MISELFFWAWIFLPIGILNSVWPYKMARFDERLDAIGSSRSWSETEPANWKVTLVRVSGYSIVLINVVNFGTTLVL
jgi:hypothetical protein